MPTKQQILDQITALNAKVDIIGAAARDTLVNQGSIGRGVDILIAMSHPPAQSLDDVGTALTSLSGRIDSASTPVVQATDQSRAIAATAAQATVDIPPAPPAGPPA